MIFLAPPAEVLTACSGSLGQAGEWAISLLPRECWLTFLVQRSENLALGVCLTSSGMTAQIANICSAQTTDLVATHVTRVTRVNSLVRVRSDAAILLCYNKSIATVDSNEWRADSYFNRHTLPVPPPRITRSNSLPRRKKSQKHPSTLHPSDSTW